MTEEQSKMPDVIYQWPYPDSIGDLGSTSIIRKNIDDIEYIRADLVGNQLTKTGENVTCAAVSNAGESMVPDGFMIVSESMWNDLQKQVSRNGDAQSSALNFYKRITAGCDMTLFSQQDFKDDQTIRALLQTPSVCTHSGGQSIETVPVAVADAMQAAMARAESDLARFYGSDTRKPSSTWVTETLNLLQNASAQYNNFKQGGA